MYLNKIKFQTVATVHTEVTHERVSKIISSLKDKGYISVKLKYKTDSKEIEQRQIIPKPQNINRYSQKVQEGIEENNYPDSQKQTYPIGENNKDIINNIKNKKIYNNTSNSNKKYKSDYKGRDYTNFDFTKLYTNADAFV